MYRLDEMPLSYYLEVEILKEGRGEVEEEREGGGEENEKLEGGVGSVD